MQSKVSSRASSCPEYSLGEEVWRRCLDLADIELTVGKMLARAAPNFERLYRRRQPTKPRLMIRRRLRRLVRYLTQWIGENWQVPEDWLIESYSAQDVDGLIRRYPWNDRILTQYQQEMLKGDEIWTWQSSGESWEHLRGIAGYALCRNGRTILAEVTIRN